MKALKTALALTLGALIAGPALAVSIDKVTVTPTSGARVGDKVTLQVNMADIEQGFCGLSVNFGEDTPILFKVKPDAKLPLIFEHTYKTPGKRVIEVRGKRIESALDCSNKQKLDYEVAAAPAAPLPAVVAASACPTNWVLKGKVAKNGAFTCAPKKGVKEAKKPEQPLPCPAGTSYFTKGKALGCEKN